MESEQLLEQHKAWIRGALTDRRLVNDFVLPAEISEVHPFMPTVGDAEDRLHCLIAFLHDVVDCHDFENVLTPRGKAGMGWLLSAMRDTCGRINAHKRAWKEVSQERKSLAD